MNLDLEDAIKRWLAARERSLGGSGRGKLERLTAATNLLYAAFAQDWHGDERTLHVAFVQFSEALVAGWDFGYRYLEVSLVYPNRSS